MNGRVVERTIFLLPTQARYSPVLAGDLSVDCVEKIDARRATRAGNNEREETRERERERGHGIWKSLFVCLFQREDGEENSIDLSTPPICSFVFVSARIIVGVVRQLPAKS